MWVLQIYTYSQQHGLYFKDRHRISSNHTIISCLCGCLILTFKCAQVCYWVRTIEAQTHSRNIMKWDTKAVRAVLTSGPAIDIPAPDLTVISTQQRRGEAGRRGKSGEEGVTNYNDNCPLLHASQMCSCHRQICLITFSSGPSWQGLSCCSFSLCVAVWQDTVENETYDYNSHSYTFAYLENWQWIRRSKTRP